MRSPRHSHHDLPSKIGVLEANAYRVRSQNIALKKVLNDAPLHNALSDLVRAVKDAEYKLHSLKRRQNPTGIESHTGVHREKNIQLDIKKCQTDLQELMDQTLLWEKQQAQIQAKTIEQLKKESKKQEALDDQELNRMERHAQTFLNKYQQNKGRKLHEQIHQQADQALEQQSQLYCKDIEAEIGMLICEFEYLKEIENQEAVAREIKKINKNNLEVQLGKATVTLISNQLKNFVIEAGNRLNYECRLLHAKTKSLLECIQLSQKSTDSSTLNKYGEQIAALQSRLFSIKMQATGMQLKEKQLVSKQQRVQRKLDTVGQIEQDLEIKTGRQSMERVKHQVQINIEKCQVDINNLLRLKRRNTIHTKK